MHLFKYRIDVCLTRVSDCPCPYKLVVLIIVQCPLPVRNNPITAEGLDFRGLSRLLQWYQSGRSLTSQWIKTCQSDNFGNLLRTNEQL